MILSTSMVVLVVALSAIPVVDSNRTVHLTNGEWPPYTSEKLKHGGVFTHIVTEAFKHSGYTVTYEYHPWNRSYQIAQEGDADGSLTWAPTPERELDFIFSDPVTFNKKVIFHLKSFSFDWKNIRDLEGLRIGATDNYTYGSEFDAAASNGQLSVEFVSADELNIRKLLAGRIEIFPMEIEVGYALIDRELTSSQARLITNHPRPIQTTPICVAFSRKIKPERVDVLLKDFNKGLDYLRASGRYEELMWDSRTGKYRNDSAKPHINQ
ncbi:substrate-binding periplasmic protein [Hahella ganghwensis]|uniref:substrate-binding periplasmic protein n=1 Tax=Hahella ganghwensis TaxID=286420 RepID=UPI0003AADD7A|nr:transporter substrate-binding domain-containing protein [Hahella ganghwensis]